MSKAPGIKKTFDDGEIYHWQKVSTSWTNTSGYFAVVIGANVTVSQVSGTALFVVQDANGNNLDVVYVAFTTSGLSMQYLPRKMLVPPGGQLQINTGTIMAQVVLCATLEAALKIL